MKIDRHIPLASTDRVKPVLALRAEGRESVWPSSPRPLVLLFLAAWFAASMSQVVDGQSPPTRHDSSPLASSPQPSAASQRNPQIATRAGSNTQPVSRSAGSQSKSTPLERSDPRAVGLLHQVVANLVHGPAFHAKVRETIWTNGREVVGVGTYEQAGGSSGRFHLQVTMHDGEGKHRLQQISDGRLAWTRSEIAGRVSLRRVDVGRLDEWVGKTVGDTAIAPSLTVGAWAELLTTIERDHILAVVGAKLENEPVWVLTGRLREDRRAQVLADSGRSEWPMLYPTRVHIAIRSKPDPDSHFGELLPVRFEFWSDPIAQAESTSQSNTDVGGRLITLIEMYSIQPITPPSAEHFRFENQDAEVNFVNETDRYIQLFGVHLTDREMRQLRR